MTEDPISRDKAYKTKRGLETVLYTVSGKGEFPVVGQVCRLGGHNSWISACWTAHGKSPVENGGYDLVEVRPRHKRTMWLNIYRDCDGSVAYPTRNAADFGASGFRISCVRLEFDFEEGQFDG